MAHAGSVSHGGESDLCGRSWNTGGTCVERRSEEETGSKRKLSEKRPP